MAAPAARTAAGLPVGVEVIGALHEDDTALTFAELVSEVTSGVAPPPIG